MIPLSNQVFLRNCGADVDHCGGRYMAEPIAPCQAFIHGLIASAENGGYVIETIPRNALHCGTQMKDNFHCISETFKIPLAAYKPEFDPAFAVMT